MILIVVREKMESLQLKELECGHATGFINKDQLVCLLEYFGILRIVKYPVGALQ